MGVPIAPVRFPAFSLLQAQLAALQLELGGATASTTPSQHASSSAAGHAQDEAPAAQACTLAAQIERQLQQKQALAAELQQRLRHAGMDEAALGLLSAGAFTTDGAAAGQRPPPGGRAAPGEALRRFWLCCG
jgi:hypothetical protein